MFLSYNAYRRAVPKFREFTNNTKLKVSFARFFFLPTELKFLENENQLCAIPHAFAAQADLCDACESTN